MVGSTETLPGHLNFSTAFATNSIPCQRLAPRLKATTIKETLRTRKAAAFH